MLLLSTRNQTRQYKEKTSKATSRSNRCNTSRPPTPINNLPGTVRSTYDPRHKEKLALFCLINVISLPPGDHSRNAAAAVHVYCYVRTWEFGGKTGEFGRRNTKSAGTPGGDLDRFETDFCRSVNVFRSPQPNHAAKRKFHFVFPNGPISARVGRMQVFVGNHDRIVVQERSCRVLSIQRKMYENDGDSHEHVRGDKCERHGIFPPSGFGWRRGGFG